MKTMKTMGKKKRIRFIHFLVVLSFFLFLVFSL
jgi:hypothetical protein